MYRDVRSIFTYGFVDVFGCCFFSEFVAEYQCASVAFFEKKLLALQSSSSRNIIAYDHASTFKPLGTITIPGYFSDFVDMAACWFYRCLYLADAHKA